MNRLMLVVLALLLLLVSSDSIAVQENESGITCVTYFTGIGCPHCAKTDPIVLGKLLRSHENLIIIEFEVYKSRENAPLMELYNSNYGSGYGIPLLVFKKGQYIIGDTPIIENADSVISALQSNACPLPYSYTAFEGIDLAKLPGKPRVWGNSRVLLKEGNETPNSNLLKKLLFKDYNIQAILGELKAKKASAIPVELSGKEIEFKHAVKIDGWLFEWNDENTGSTGFNENFSQSQSIEKFSQASPITLAKIIPLAVVDAINPCALAVLSLMLIAIITYNPEDKKKVLLAGMAFSLAVFVMYFFYGLIIINFFKFIQAITPIRLLLYKLIGVAAIVLGLLNLKDFFWYKPGTILTEMPMSLRPIVKKITSSVTSPKTAVLIGALVTIFLLPCTIGPYIIAGGILSELGLLATIPLLLVYNAIFILPMLGITLIVYGGLTKIENVSEWKDKNIRYLHLIAGIIILLLGIAMLLGWV